MQTAPTPPPRQAAAPPPAKKLEPPAPVPVKPPEALIPATVKVALLLPLSGPSGGLGHAILDAAQMAMFDAADDKFELLPRDTQGTAQGAAQAGKAVLAEGARLILGPLLAAEVEAVKPLAQDAHVNIVAFSTSAGLAGNGTWLLSFMPGEEVTRVVGFAREHGASRFAALAPDTPYGQLAVEALRNATASGGGTVEHVEFYDPATKDFRQPVQYLAKQAAFDKPSGDKPGGNKQGFDAVLMPEGGEKLKAVASLLPYYEIDPAKVRFLGTGLWDEPGVEREPALTGGWFAAPAPDARSDFEQHYRQLYNRAPPRLATLGYDAVALAALLAHAPGGGNFSTPALTDPNGFAGVGGIFRLKAEGLVERGLAVLEIHPNGPAVVSPAPETFLKPAS